MLGTTPTRHAIRHTGDPARDAVLALSALDHIIIHEACEHNLACLTLAIPKRALTVFTGPSGSGKTSLAFDTLFAEGRRRYLESLSAYARQFVGDIQRPSVTEVRGLGPTIAIDQRTVTTNPRSTVGTITEIYDFMRVLWARLGLQECTKCGGDVGRGDISGTIDGIMRLPIGTKLTVYAPLVRNRKGMFKDEIERARRSGYARMRIDGHVVDLAEDITLRKTMRHNIDVIVDRIKVKPGADARLLDSINTAMETAAGECLVEVEQSGSRPRVVRLNEENSCATCGIAFPSLSTQSFSFNSPVGLCDRCQGLGTTREMNEELVVPDPSLSIDDGAIAAWVWPTKKNPIILSREILEGIAATHHIDLSAPYASLNASQRTVLMHGDTTPVTITWERQGITGSYQMVFEGILDDLMTQFRETTREAVRAFLEPFVATRSCAACGGSRLKAESRAVKVAHKGIDEVTTMAVSEAATFFEDLTFEGSDAVIAGELVPEIAGRLRFLTEVGLGYLQLGRPGPTLSGGESQRIRLATQLGSGLTGVTYILDEPSIGLHARDQMRLLRTLQDLRDRGNTIVVVEHDEATMRAADYLVDFGPGAGRHGGEVVFAGPGEALEDAHNSMTADYLSGRRAIGIPTSRRAHEGGAITVRGARQNNLRNIDVAFPLGVFICVTGVSGAGKSTLVNEILLPAAMRTVNRAQRVMGKHDEVVGLEQIDRIISIDQRPIGRTPRSNPATYTKVFDLIRKHFALLPESRIYGYAPGRFSFNVAGGRCEACKGAGVRTIEMQFLANVYVPCETCRGKRFNEATLRVHYRGHSIADVLSLTVREALDLFSEHPGIARIMQTLDDVGLGYVQLGQPSPTLSGGEAQRIKLSRELARPQLGHTLYTLDEPSTGLHYEDVRHLLEVIQRLVDANNTVVVIEHNLDIIKVADHIIDLGPEGGADGGELVVEGPPERVVEAPESHTGRFLGPVLAGEGVRLDLAT